MDEEQEDKCESCEVAPAEEMTPCPYQVAKYGDYALCNCCKECHARCKEKS